MKDNILERKEYIDFNVSEPYYRKDRNYYFLEIELIYDNDETENLYRGGFKSKKEANKERNIIIGQLYTKTYVIKDNIKVSTFFINWLENVKRKEITDDSYRAYKNVVYNYIAVDFKNILIVNLHPGKILDFYKNVVGKYPSMLKLCSGVMNTGLKYALKKSVITYNPAKGIKLPKAKRVNETRDEDYSNKVNTLNKEQLKILVNSAKNSPIYLHILFAGLMGLRRSEIIGLKYSDIDFLHRTLTVSRQLGVDPNKSKDNITKKQYTKQEIGLKTYSSYRTLDIPNIVFEAILEERKIYERNRKRRINDKNNPFRDWNYIICSTYGNPRSKGYHISYFKRLLEINNLPNIRFHDLRKTYSTLLLKENFSAKAVSKLMGHSTEKMTVDVYGDKINIICDPIPELEEFITKILPKNEEDKWKTEEVIIDQRIIDYLLPC